MSKHLSPTEVIRRTVQLERYRAIAAGIFESYGVFLLMILVRHFDGTPLDKSVVAAAGTSGLLLTPLMLFLSRKLGLSSPRALSVLFGFSSMAFFAVMVTRSLQF